MITNNDQMQRELALNPQLSFIVQAPAGSGKTELLIQRLLLLLAGVQKPEEILAITFTKKAAHEMRERVLHALKEAEKPEPASAHKKITWRLAKKVLKRDKQLNWELISNPNQLRIQTIDALCAYLTRQLPLLSTFGAQPDLAEKPQTLYEAAVHEVLLHVEEELSWSDAIARLLLHLDNDFNKLHELLVNLLAKRDQWLPHIHFDTHDDNIKVQLEQDIALIIEDHLQTLTSRFSPDIVSELLALARYAADNLALQGISSPLLNISALPSCDADSKSTWLALAQLLLTKTDEWRKRFDTELGFPAPSGSKNPEDKARFRDYKTRMAAFVESLQHRHDLRLALATLSHLPNHHIESEQWTILLDLIHVLKIATAQLRVIFQQQGKIDFVENSLAALTALGNAEHPTDLALALDYRIQHILIDEFQDTSTTQYALLEKLTLGWEENDGRTLFVVGDPMQSIYRFREAEVGLFIRMRQNGIGNLRLHPINLTLNFRSTPAIVNWNNATFQKIFPSFTDIANGAVSYSNSISPHQIQSDESGVTIHGFKEQALEAQAQQIVSTIQQTKINSPDHSIAILVRSRTHLVYIIPALKAANINYRALDIDPLADRIIIQDLLALTRALLHPYDRIAWLSILRAPWCGLTLTDLHAISGDHPNHSLLDLLNDSQLKTKISADGQQRLQRVLPFLTQHIAHRDRISLRLWIEHAWIALGGPACLTTQNEIDDAMLYFEYLDKLSAGEHYIETENLAEQINDLYAAAAGDERAVQILTMHSAKGLEFDTVILPHLERKMPPEDKALLQWMEHPLAHDKLALMLAPINSPGQKDTSIYHFISRQKKIKTEHEANRLFYVATTRAKKQLHLLFSIKDEFNNSAGSFLHKLYPLLDTSNLFKSHTETTSPSTASSHYLKRLTLGWQHPLQYLAPPKASRHQTYEGFHLVNNIARFVGTITHTILQQLSLRSMQWWQQKSSDQQLAVIFQLLQNTGLTGGQLTAAANLVQRAVNNTLNDPRGLWILQGHNSAQSEYAVTITLDDKIENIVIDRTFVDEANIRWIIDYKTTTFTQGDLSTFLAHEQDKYLEQMRKYAIAMQTLDQRQIKLGLYFPALPAWYEWPYPA